MSSKIEMNHQKQFLEFSDYQIFDARTKTTDYLIECSATSIKVVKELSMIEMEPVVTKNYEFQCRYESITFALFNFSDNQDSDANIMKTFNRILLYKLRVLDRDLV